MHISPRLAKLNAERFRDFPGLPERPALFAFAGDVYTGFEAHSLDDAGVAFAQNHVRMLSGLYGLLRPLDAIRPYRLEMGTRWAPRRQSLTDWWGGRIAELLLEQLANEGSSVMLNLASQEYFAAVKGKLPGTRITPASCSTMKARKSLFDSSSPRRGSCQRNGASFAKACAAAAISSSRFATRTAQCYPTWRGAQ